MAVATVRLRMSRRWALRLAVSLAMALAVTESLAALVRLPLCRRDLPGPRDRRPLGARARRAQRHDLGLRFLLEQRAHVGTVDGTRDDGGGGSGDGNARDDVQAHVPGERCLEAGEHRPEVERVEKPAAGWSRLGRLGRLERGREGPARAEDERLDGRLRDAQLGGHFAIGESLPLTEEDGATLLVGEAGEGVLDSEELVPLMVARGDRLLDHLDVVARFEAGAPRLRAEPRDALVLCHLQEPRLGRLRLEAAHEVAAGTQVRRLDGVLGLLR